MVTALATERANDALTAYGVARSTVPGMPLSSDELRKTEAYWRACKYLALGMIYLQDNPLLKEPLSQSTSRTGFWAIGAQAQAWRLSTYT